MLSVSSAGIFYGCIAFQQMGVPSFTHQSPPVEHLCSLSCYCFIKTLQRIVFVDAHTPQDGLTVGFSFESFKKSDLFLLTATVLHLLTQQVFTERAVHCGCIEKFSVAEEIRLECESLMWERGRGASP